MDWTGKLEITMLMIQDNSDTDKDVIEGIVSAAKSLAEKLDATTADRDLWRARCEKIVEMLEPGPMTRATDTSKWLADDTRHAAAVKIMKGEE